MLLVFSVSLFLLCLCFSLTDRVASGAKRRSLTSACGSREETLFLTRYCFSLISLGTYALRLCLVCVVDVRVCPRSSVGILEEALDLTVDLCTALFLQPASRAASNPAWKLA